MKQVVCFVCGGAAAQERGRGRRDILCKTCFDGLKKSFRACYLCEYFIESKSRGGKGVCKKRQKMWKADWQCAVVSLVGSCGKFRRSTGAALHKTHLKLMNLKYLLPDVEEEKGYHEYKECPTCGR